MWKAIFRLCSWIVISVGICCCLIMNAGGSGEHEVLLRCWRRVHAICNPLMANVFSDRSPLHGAAYQGRLFYVRNLVALGWAVDVSTLDNVSPLHEACLRGHYECAKYLLECGANVDKITTDGATPLFFACSSGNPACVQLILQYSSSLHIQSHLGSPIHEAAKKNYKECLELLLTRETEIDVEFPVMGTPLYSACMFSAVDCVKLLLQSGADVRLGCGQDTPLHAAVRSGSAPVVKLLLEFGANECCRNAEGKTPLDLSKENSPVRSALESREVWSLAHISRLSVRRSLGRSRLDKVSSLLIPECLKEYLLYK